VISKICLVVAALFSTTALSHAAAFQREATLKENVQVWSENICLQDLVQENWIQNRCMVEKQKCCKWKLGDGSRSQSLSRAEIQSALSEELIPGISLKLIGAEEVTVTQTKRALTVEEIQIKIRQTIAERVGEKIENVSIRNVRFTSPAYVSLNEESDWDVLPTDKVGEQGPIKIIQTKGVAETLGWAQAEIQVLGDVYVAKRTVRPTEEVTSHDFEVKKVNILNIQGGLNSVYRSGQLPVGYRAKFSVIKGQPLSFAAIERVPLVQLGDFVTLILRSDSLRVSTKGVVQSTGALGDMVTVQLNRYNRTFRGRLQNGKVVEVWL